MSLKITRVVLTYTITGSGKKIFFFITSVQNKLVIYGTETKRVCPDNYEVWKPLRLENFNRYKRSTKVIYILLLETRSATNIRVNGITIVMTIHKLWEN